MKIIYKVLLILMLDLLAVGLVAASQTEMQSFDCESSPKGTFDLSKIDESITKEFMKAWNRSHNGIDSIEAGIYIFRNVDGSYRCIEMRYTNEPGGITTTMDPAAIALVHTHPTRLDPKPSDADIRVADKYCVPIFTITSWGMYMYDPKTKKITLIQHNLEWLSASKWKRNAQ